MFQEIAGYIAVCLTILGLIVLIAVIIIDGVSLIKSRKRCDEIYQNTMGELYEERKKIFKNDEEYLNYLFNSYLNKELKNEKGNSRDS